MTVEVTVAVVSAATNESDAAASDSARDMRFDFMARMRGYVYIWFDGCWRASVSKLKLKSKRPDWWNDKRKGVGIGR